MMIIFSALLALVEAPETQTTNSVEQDFAMLVCGLAYQGQQPEQFAVGLPNGFRTDLSINIHPVDPHSFVDGEPFTKIIIRQSNGKETISLSSSNSQNRMMLYLIATEEAGVYHAALGPMQDNARKRYGRCWAYEGKEAREAYLRWEADPSTVGS
jgi:hypothetical protein